MTVNYSEIQRGANLSPGSLICQHGMQSKARLCPKALEGGQRRRALTSISSLQSLKAAETPHGWVTASSHNSRAVAEMRTGVTKGSIAYAQPCLFASAAWISNQITLGRPKDLLDWKEFRVEFSVYFCLLAVKWSQLFFTEILIKLHTVTLIRYL